MSGYCEKHKVQWIGGCVECVNELVEGAFDSERLKELGNTMVRCQIHLTEWPAIAGCFFCNQDRNTAKNKPKTPETLNKDDALRIVSAYMSATTGLRQGTNTDKLLVRSVDYLQSLKFEGEECK